MRAVFSKSITKAAEVIKSGGLVICPSEGVYGISCSVFNEDAVKKVIAVKERDVSKGLIIVDSSLSLLSRYIDDKRVDDSAYKLMSSMWPGPHTFILPMNDDFHSIALKDNHTVAVRITAFETLANLCKESGVPLVSTSANISGHEATSEISLLDKKLLDRVQLVLDLPCGGQNAPTSIYDTLTHTLVRKGPGWKE